MGVYLNKKTNLYDVKGKYRILINGETVYKDYRGPCGVKGIKSKKEAKIIDENLRAELEQKYYFNTDDIAAESMEKIEKQMPEEAIVTVNDLFEKYFSDCRRANKETSVYTTKKALQKLFAEIKYKDYHLITSEYIQRKLDQMNEDNYSLHYIDRCFFQCNKFCTWLQREEYMEQNVVDKVKKIKRPNLYVDKSKKNYFTKEEFDMFIENVDEQLYYTLFTLLFYTGMRKGEALALRFKDINYDENTICIDKTLSGLSTYENPILTPPKTSNSVRTIYMPENIRKLLMEWYEKNKRYYGFEEDWFLFTDNGHILSTTVIERKWKYYMDYGCGYIYQENIENRFSEKKEIIRYDGILYKTVGGKQMKKTYHGYIKITEITRYENQRKYMVAPPFEPITIHALRHSAVSMYVNTLGSKVNLLALAKHFGHDKDIFSSFPRNRERDGNTVLRKIRQKLI